MDRTLVALIEAEYRRYKSLGEGAFAQLDAPELAIDNGGANSVATIVWHISGNLQSRFTEFLTSDGEKPWRNRESEFERREVSPEELREKWERGWTVLQEALAGLSDADLSRKITIRGTELRVDEALLRSLTHTSYHVGQIVHVAKSIRGNEWKYLSIPPGGTAAYNRSPTYEHAADHASGLRGEST